MAPAIQLLTLYNLDAMQINTGPVHKLDWIDPEIFKSSARLFTSTCCAMPFAYILSMPQLITICLQLSSIHTTIVILHTVFQINLALSCTDADKQNGSWHRR